MTNTSKARTAQQNLYRQLQSDKWMGLMIRYAIALVLIVFAVAPALWVVSASFNPAKSLVSGTLLYVCTFWVKQLKHRVSGGTRSVVHTISATEKRDVDPDYLFGCAPAPVL